LAGPPSMVVDPVMVDPVMVDPVMVVPAALVRVPACGTCLSSGAWWLD
jgi:hypothetical protein